MIKTITGDMTTIKKGIIVHQVNCQGVMGSGIALEIRKKFPNVYAEYKKLCNAYSDSDVAGALLGKAQLVELNQVLYGANLFGQFKYGSQGKFTNEEALKNAFAQLKVELTQKELTHLPIYIPMKIGAERGGGNHKIIISDIVSLFNTSEKDKETFNVNLVDFALGKVIPVVEL